MQTDNWSFLTGKDWSVALYPRDEKSPLGNISLCTLLDSRYLLSQSSIAAIWKRYLFLPWSSGKGFCPPKLVSGSLNQIWCVFFASKYLGWCEHINFLLSFLGMICSSHWNSAGNWRLRKRNRNFVNNQLPATAALKKIKFWPPVILHFLYPESFNSWHLCFTF